MARDSITEVVKDLEGKTAASLFVRRTSHATTDRVGIHVIRSGNVFKFGVDGYAVRRGTLPERCTQEVTGLTRAQVREIGQWLLDITATE